eukprot:1867509-Heterocapsa_arctica.AAC.1
MYVSELTAERDGASLFLFAVREHGYLWILRLPIQEQAKLQGGPLGLSPEEATGGRYHHPRGAGHRTGLSQDRLV